MHGTIKNSTILLVILEFGKGWIQQSCLDKINTITLSRFMPVPHISSRVAALVTPATVQRLLYLSHCFNCLVFFFSLR